MKIQIRAKFRPFSHTPGTSCVIPRTNVILKAFPTRLVIDEHVVELPIKGPVQNFTVCQDLERDSIFVFGKAFEGYFKLKITGEIDGIQIVSQKGPIQSVKIPLKLSFLKEKEMERLSLGNHRAQDWDLVKRRGDLKEILPFLFFLGQKVPKSKPVTSGTALLLKLPEKRADLERALLSFFQAGFFDLLVPRLFDDQYQGLVSHGDGKGDPFYLLEEGAKVIRSLFICQNQNELALLPNLPIDFDAGRMLNLEAFGIGKIDLEWSKKRLKKVVLRASNTTTLNLKLQKEIKKFRLNRSKWLDRDEPVQMTENTTYFLDRFEK